ncbi:hypothetical protein [Roseiarcus fermentans]|nr:hypothetical protein [Roseiarcus fermentans]
MTSLRSKEREGTSVPARFRVLTAAACALALSARAGWTESSSEILLGEIPRFSDETSARAACGADPVVWADRKSGFFYPKFHPDFGKTATGAYACYSRAKKANYWSLTPDGEGGREGREFPLIFCTQCS